MRDSCTVLREPSGEVPLGYSPFCESSRVKYAFIRENIEGFSARELCRIFEVSESGKADGREINLPLLDWKTHPLHCSYQGDDPLDKSLLCPSTPQKTLANTGGFVVIFGFVSCPAINPLLKLKRSL